MRINRISASVFLGVSTSLATGGAAFAQAPISAIDWLSDVIEAPAIPLQPEGTDIPSSAGVAPVDVAPLEDMSIDGVGLFPASVAGLPVAFWGPTPVAELAGLLRAQPTTLPLAAQRLLKRILLAELNPPVDASADHAFFLARLDTLLTFGALPDAQALLERAGIAQDTAVFRRWFDISLLQGDGTRACATLRAVPDIAPTFSARIFCLARNNDWPAAALSLETARALGFVSEAEDLLMARFLDPDLFEGLPLAAPPDPLTPLSYRMLAALGEAPPARNLPLAFNHALLSETQGWKPRLEAAERLARTNGITPGELFALYAERSPAASGGLWDRVAAVQAFDVALLAEDPEAVEETLPKAMQELDRVGLLEVFADFYGAPLTRLEVPEKARVLADQVILMDPDAPLYQERGTDDILSAILLATSETPTGPTVLSASIAEAFWPDPEVPDAFQNLIDTGAYGAATLRALLLLSNDVFSDPQDVSTALRVLRVLGFEDTARALGLSLVMREAQV